MNAVPALDRNQVTTLFDGMFTEFFAAESGANGELASVQFFEKRPDLGEIKAGAPASWELRAPRTSALRIATSGLLIGRLDNLWISWLDGDRLGFASLGQEQPGQLTLEQGERLIEPAIMIPGDLLLQLGWLPGKRSLLVHRVHAPADGKQMNATKAEIGPMDEPLLAAAAAVPGSDKELVHLFTLEAEPGKDPCAVHRIVQSTTLVKETRSDPIAGLTPLPPGRLGTSVNPKGVAAMAFVARRAADRAAVLVVVSFSNQEPHVSVGTSELPDLQQDAISAHVDFYKRVGELKFLVYAVTGRGALTRAATHLDEARVVRKDVGADYGYPIVMATGASYELGHDRDGKPLAINLGAL